MILIKICEARSYPELKTGALIPHYTFNKNISLNSYDKNSSIDLELGILKEFFGSSYIKRCVDDEFGSGEDRYSTFFEYYRGDRYGITSENTRERLPAYKCNVWISDVRDISGEELQTMRKYSIAHTHCDT